MLSSYVLNFVLPRVERLSPTERGVMRVRLSDFVENQCFLAFGSKQRTKQKKCFVKRGVCVWGGMKHPLPSFKLDSHQNGIMRADKNGTRPEKMERAKETSTYVFSGITRIIFLQLPDFMHKKHVALAACCARASQLEEGAKSWLSTEAQLRRRCFLVW